MNRGKLVFSQLLSPINPAEFWRLSQRYCLKRKTRVFSAWDHFLCMAFAQMTFRESLRDIEACLRSRPQLYAMGIRGTVTRSNLAYANERRDWKLFEALAAVLMRKARKLYAGDAGALQLEEMVYVLDSTTVDLCMGLFPWAGFRSNKSAVKLHLLMQLRGWIPAFANVTDGKVHDVWGLDWIPVEAGSVYVFDRAYTDWGRLHSIHRRSAFFVIRGKANLRFYVAKSRQADRSTGVKCDQIIRLNGARTKELYPDRIRRIRFVDTDTSKTLTFLTNHMELDASTVAALYKRRWDIELFFKWIKQNLRIKAFYGTSENAVKTQIWIAICVYLLVAIAKKSHRISENLSRILQVVSVNVFSKDPLDQLLMKNDTSESIVDNPNQLMFKDF